MFTSSKALQCPRNVLSGFAIGRLLNNLDGLLLSLAFLIGCHRSQLNELLASKRIDTWINLGVRPSKRLAHDWDNLFLASDTVCYDLLLEWLLLLALITVCTRVLRCNSVRTELAKIAPLVLLALLNSLILDVFVEDCATVLVLDDDSLFRLHQGFFEWQGWTSIYCACT